MAQTESPDAFLTREPNRNSTHCVAKVSVGNAAAYIVDMRLPSEIFCAVSSAVERPRRTLYCPRPRSLLAFFLGLILISVIPLPVRAHPAPSLAYDHTILVQPTPNGVEVRYLLDVESVTVQFDLRHLLTKD